MNLPQPTGQAAKNLTIILTIFILNLLVACSSQSTLAMPTPPPALADELIFYNWEDDLPQSVLDAFTQETGVKVKYLVYESQEEAIDTIRAGQVYDVVVMESRFVGLLVRESLLAEINYKYVPNFKNISANFRDLVYDPHNKHSMPYNWGLTGLVARKDMVKTPVTRWADLWDPRYADHVAIWRGQPREVIALTLKSLGYSANSENPAELAAALARLLELKPHLRYVEDYDPTYAAAALATGEVVLAMGYAGDVQISQDLNVPATFVLPAEGALLWGDNFVIPANSPHQYTAELFLNFLQRPEINAQIANENHYATPNEAAYPLIDPALRNDSVVFPPNEDLKRAEIILPLSVEGQKLYDQIWQRFLDAAPQKEP
jgi:spermidine/putrescine transport system substrate-binding protein